MNRVHAPAAVAASIAMVLSLAGCGHSSPATPAAAQPAPKGDEAPRLADGHPDLNGTWDDGNSMPAVIRPGAENGSVCLNCRPGTPAPTRFTKPPPPRESPNAPTYRPEFAAKVRDLRDHQVKFDTSLHCRNPGVPRIGPPDKIVQTVGQLVFLYDDITGQAYRIVPIDPVKRQEPSADSYMGSSVGHWDGDTLVVSVDNLNDDTWLADNGKFHTAHLKVTERLRREGDVIHYRFVAEDPEVLAEPWSPPERMLRRAALELEETPPCDERSFANTTTEDYHPNAR